MKLLIQSIGLAAKAHVNQHREDVGKTPYINHPIEVMTILNVCGISDASILSAAILHDVIEDTSYTYEDLKILITESVANYVLEVTDDKSLPKMRRKELQIETMSSKSDGAKLIKIADKIANMRSIIKTPPVGWSSERKLEYFEWAKKVVEPALGINLALDQLFVLMYNLKCKIKN